MKSIVITQTDYERLKGVLQTYGGTSPNEKKSINSLQKDLERAKKVASEKIAAEVVTMNSKIRVRNVSTNKTIDMTLVYPKDANLKEQKVSILAPVGAAVLGYSIGDTITWQMPTGTSELKIEAIYYQPEANGHYSI
jgi:regulator of nucleoside diphosphate kinase